MLRGHRSTMAARSPLPVQKAPLPHVTRVTNRRNARDQQQPSRVGQPVLLRRREKIDSKKGEKKGGKRKMNCIPVPLNHARHVCRTGYSECDRRGQKKKRYDDEWEHISIHCMYPSFRTTYTHLSKASRDLLLAHSKKTEYIDAPCLLSSIKEQQ